jgi:hypothetical protein
MIEGFCSIIYITVHSRPDTGKDSDNDLLLLIFIVYSFYAIFCSGTEISSM